MLNYGNMKNYLEKYVWEYVWVLNIFQGTIKYSAMTEICIFIIYGVININDYLLFSFPKDN